MHRAWTVVVQAVICQLMERDEENQRRASRDSHLHLNDSSSQRSSQTAHIDLPSRFLRMKQCPSTHLVSSLSRTGCTIMDDMTVLAANVLCAYTLGAYVEGGGPLDRLDVDKLA